MSEKCDPSRNKDLEFWKDYLTRNPEKGKQILEKYFPTVQIPRKEPLLQWDFLYSFNLTIRDALFCVIEDWSWEQTKIYLQKQMDSGIVFTVNEWKRILRYHPQAEELPVRWNDFTPDEWAILLRRHPQFADRCPFDKFTSKQWIPVLAKHPELESRGACFDKFTAEDWKDLCDRNSDFTLHKENWSLCEDLRSAFFLRQYFIKQKKLLLGLQSAANLCNGNAETDQVTGFDMETGLPRTVNREEAVRILEPLRREQDAVYKFLSSGNTEGILPKLHEELATKVPIRNRIELENLIAVCRPGLLQFIDEFKENRPCRLKVASEIACPTRGILFYREQQEKALELLAGCVPEEINMLYEKTHGILLNRPYRELVLQLIAEHNSITREDAKELFGKWQYYAYWGGVRHDGVKKVTHKIYLRALEYLRDKGEIPVDHAK